MPKSLEQTYQQMGAHLFWSAAVQQEALGFWLNLANWDRRRGAK